MYHFHYTVDDWTNFVWSDESPFVLIFCKRTWCWRLVSGEKLCERFSPKSASSIFFFTEPPYARMEVRTIDSGQAFVNAHLDKEICYLPLTIRAPRQNTDRSTDQKALWNDKLSAYLTSKDIRRTDVDKCFILPKNPKK